MSTKRFILDHGKDLIVGGLLIAYILSDLKTPELLKEGAGSFAGLIVVAMILLLSFSLFHPSVGFLAIVLVFKLIATEGHHTHDGNDHHHSDEVLNNEIDNDFNTHVVASSQSSSSVSVVRSADSTLEQEVISRMAPIPSPVASNNEKIKPVMSKLDGVSSIA